MFASVFGWVNELTNWLSDVSGNWWFLIVIAVIAYLDSVIPVVPSETCVIIGGVAAANGEYPLWAVILCGAAGAFLGDSTAYLVGRRAAWRFERRAERRPSFARRLVWARDQLAARGGLLLITGRFIPGGRTALTLSSGITRQPRPWFTFWIAIAVAIWACYASLLGYLGGKAFEENHTAAFVVAFGASLGVTLLIELVRHLRGRSKELPVV